MARSPNTSHESDIEVAGSMGDVSPFRRRRSDAVVRSEPTDPIAAALTAAARGDEAAFGEFYDLTSSLVYGVVLKAIRDPAMAEEVTQEAFVEIWRLSPRYDPDRGSAKSWTATIAHRRAVDRVRSEQSRRNREERDQVHQITTDDTTSEEALDRLEHSRVRKALEQLSPAQREAVTLAYYSGKTYREVAVLLGIPEGTAKTRIRDGLIRLRDQFGVEQ